MIRTSLSFLVFAIAFLFTISTTAAQDAKKGRKVALLAGVQDYSDTGLSNLKYCENDVTALAAVLKSQGYKVDDIIILTDSFAAEKKKLKYAPTAENIRRELKGLVEDLRPEDTFLVAFSGHGAHLKQLKEKGLHFCAKGTNLEKPESMVSLAEVYEQLEKHCKAELKLMFVDACRNDPTDGKAADGRLESMTRPLVPDPPGGTVAFFSCSTGQKSYESDQFKHGVFFHHVIQGLKGGPVEEPIDRKGEVTVPLLEDYLTRSVPLAVKKDRDDRSATQVPERKGSLRGQVVLAWFDPNQGEIRKDFAGHLAAVIHFSLENEYLRANAAKKLDAWRKSGEMGNAEAQHLVANCYLQGYGVDKNPKEAARWLRLAAEQNLPHAQNRLGACYRMGLGVEPDPREALKWLQRGAEQGFAGAHYNLSNMYKTGEGVAKDEKLMVKWLRAGADLKYVPCVHELGKCYLNGVGIEKDEKAALQYFRLGADLGYSLSQTILGNCYSQGAGVAKDPKEAVKWYRLAADQRNFAAQDQLGYAYQTGFGVEANPKEAVKWYRLAADQHYDSAQMHLGTCYLLGTGVEKDEKEGVKWLRLAADQKFRSAQNNLGYCYMTGSGVEVDYKEGVRLYRLAADQDLPDAQNNLANQYVLGLGVEKDLKEAVKWYRKAADQKLPAAMNALGIAYKDGSGVEKDVAEAVQWFRKAVETGSPEAQFNLGICYENGEGIVKDQAQAIEWYRKAAKSGVPRATARLKELGVEP